MTRSALQGPPFNPGDLVVTRAGYFGLVMNTNGPLLVYLGDGTTVHLLRKDVSAVLLPDVSGRQSFPGLIWAVGDRFVSPVGTPRK